MRARDRSGSEELRPTSDTDARWKRSPAHRPLHVWIDFDGTLVVPNVAVELVGRFGQNGTVVAHEVDELLHRGAITLREAWEREIAILPLDRLDEMIEYACEHAPLRPGARELIALLDRKGVPTTVLSGGVDFYIRPVLERKGIRWPFRSDSLTRTPQGQLGIAHPYGHATCRLCGICKAQAVRSEPDRTAVFIGDGGTDRYAAEVADVVFARGRLHEYCRARGIPSHPFEDFGPVVQWLESRLSGDTVPLDPVGSGLSGSECPISRELTASGDPSSVPTPR
ncbi:MAG: HAD-IB family phosphatase [Thermoplasmata archaeon]|nr:HAD-IB family phosphatase [Thermoplasmata archaeon]MCI4359428.1 HAD-IB family phosphatase [Thermoplasmata archaeon]